MLLATKPPASHAYRATVLLRLALFVLLATFGTISMLFAINAARVASPAQILKPAHYVLITISMKREHVDTMLLLTLLIRAR